MSEAQVAKFDGFKWGLVVAIVGTAIWGNQYFAEQALLWRVIGILVLGAVALLVAAQTTKGRDAVAFTKEARTEIRKVVWPTRQETIQTTFIVMIVVTLMSLFLWGVDALLVRIVGFLTGQGS